MPRNSLQLNWQKLPAARFRSDAALQDDWDRLNASQLNLPFMSAAQVCIALDAFSTGEECLFCANDANGLIRAIFVLSPDGAIKWRSFQPSQLPLGPWVSDGSTPLSELVDGLKRHLPFTCLALTVSQIDPRAEARPEPKTGEEAVDYIETSWIELDGDFSTYWEARGKNLKQNLRKRRKRLAEEGLQTSLRILTQPREMADAVRQYGLLESSGWKAHQGTAIHADNDQGHFYIQVLETAAQKGEARIYDYRVGEDCVAIDLCLVRDNVIVILKTAYDEKFKDYSPAFLLREEQLQQLFTEGKIRRVEFYGRFMEWHSRWTEQTRALYHLTVYRWAWVAKLADAVRRLRGARAPISTVKATA